MVEYFVQKSIANGIDIIRIFDAFNDLRNLETSVKACKKEGGHAQIALCYTLGEAYTLDYWKEIAKRIEEMGADSICIKDMAGLLVPYEAEALVKALKASTKLPIQLHTHYTSGDISQKRLSEQHQHCKWARPSQGHDPVLNRLAACSSGLVALLALRAPHRK